MLNIEHVDPAIVFRIFGTGLESSNTGKRTHSLNQDSYVGHREMQGTVDGSVLVYSCPCDVKPLSV